MWAASSALILDLLSQITDDVSFKIENKHNGEINDRSGKANFLNKNMVRPVASLIHVNAMYNVKEVLAQSIMTWNDN
jgi:hypothetical protein